MNNEISRLHPPVTHIEVKDLIEGLKSVQTNTIDGIVLSNMVQTCYLLALKKKNQLIALSIIDIAKGGVVQNNVEVGDSRLGLWPEAIAFLQGYLDYIKDSRSPLKPTAALFPTKKNRRYTARLRTHLEAAQEVVGIYPLSLDNIRQSGICSYYSKLEYKGVHAKDCLKRTAEFARISYKQAKGILTGRWTP